MADLLALWSRDIARLAPEAGTELHRQQGENLLSRWTETHRRYHTAVHLTEMLLAVDELARAGEVTGPGAIRARIATWFHDAVYDPTAPPGRNEHRSAQLARDHLHRLGTATDEIDRIEALILMTVTHEDAAGDVLSRAFHDADLWILSAPVDRFDAYCEQVREEYRHVPDPAYHRGRATVLRPLAERERLYLTGHAQREWEDRGRSNLGRELARLG